MYDRSSMSPGSYSYPAYPVQSQQHKQYPTAHSTSSAFSASANPNEDWTKISDLAERRRIQNRIAQRNYRKKLKKRLEDLEKRAGSSSASPEQKHEELPQPAKAPSAPASRGSRPHRSSTSSSSQARAERGGGGGGREVVNQQFVLPLDDRSMFAEQFTRQLSTSPPPFTDASIPKVDNLAYTTTAYSPAAAYCGLPAAHPMDVSALYPPYLSSHLPASYGSHVAAAAATPSIKYEFYGEEEINPFNMSYASMAGVDLSSTAAHAYEPVYTPPLSSDSFDQNSSSPESNAYPHTP